MRERTPSTYPPDLTTDSFRLLVEGVRDYALFMLDNDGLVLTWNRGAERIKGYSAAEILGRHFSLFYCEEDLAAHKPQTELQVALRDGSLEDEGWRRRKDGSRFWANVVITALYDDAGQHRGFAKVTRDLTEQRRAKHVAEELVREQVARTTAEYSELQLREERERYKALSKRLEVILEAVADGIVVQERSGAVIFANSAAARMSGFASVDELLHAPAGELVTRFDLFDEQGAAFDPTQLPGRLVLQGAASASAVVRVCARTGNHEWWAVIRASPVKNDAGVTELAVNVWHDVSVDRKRKEYERYIAKATAALASSIELPAVLNALAEQLVPGLADWCGLHLLEGEQLRVITIAHSDPARVELARELSARYPLDDKQPLLLWQVIRSGQTALYAELSADILRQSAHDAEHLQVLQSLGLASLIVVPLRIRERVIGTLTLMSAESKRHYGALDVTLAEEIGRRAGSAIENARLYSGERQVRERFQLIARVGETLSSTLDYEQTLHNVVDTALPTLGDFAFFDIVEDANVRRVAAAHADASVSALIKQTTWLRSERTDLNVCALSSGSAGFHPNIDDAWRRDVALGPEHLSLLRQVALCSLITVPLKRQNEVLGSLTFCFGKSHKHHTLDDLALAEELARRAAVAVVQARLYAEARAAVAAAAEASRIKDDFLATVSHELRTPLNAILGWSALLRSQPNGPALLKGLEVIHRNAEAQAKIIDDILDVSRIITGKLLLDLKPIDLMAVCNDAIEVVRPSTLAKRIAIDCQKPLETCWLVADPDRLQQVIWNLLSNAVKFTEPGGVVKLALRRQNSQIEITVTDTGRGIDAEFIAHVFDRFKQADASTTRRVGGLGLGLAIVRHIVELHGGVVTATSPGLGQGSSFSIHLPVRSAHDSDAPVPQNAAAQATLLPQGLRILIVDDELDGRELLQSVLETAGAHIQTASSASDAFALFQSFMPDLLISDIAMPGEDGYTLVRRVRALAPQRGGQIPAIALTAYARAEDRELALNAGFTAHLGKPVSSEILLSTVAELTRSFTRARQTV